MEVKSAFCISSALQKKILNILQAVLLSDPDTRTASLYRNGHEPKFFDEDVEISLNDVLKGWRIRLSLVWV